VRQNSCINSVNIILGDQLGSTSVVVNSTGSTIKGTQGYYPYGETRYGTGPLFTDKLFTPYGDKHPLRGQAGQQQVAGQEIVDCRLEIDATARGGKSVRLRQVPSFLMVLIHARAHFAADRASASITGTGGTQREKKK
jgi:hypothetical protein